jgi:peptidyl-prolyl cis-trans isomerase B (cyclophilin B)
MTSVLALVAAWGAAAAAQTAPAAPAAAPQEALIETSKGTIVVRLLPDLAPRHVAHFVKTARAGGYDGTTFHRVIAGGLIQGGDPLSKDPKKAELYGTGGLGLLKAEFSQRPFTRGVVGTARRGAPDSGGSQFFIVLAEQPALLGQYTIFGEVVSGLEVADQVSLTPAAGDRARERVEMKVTLREAAPAPAPAAPAP